FFFVAPATPVLYSFSLHDALPICAPDRFFLCLLHTEGAPLGWRAIVRSRFPAGGDRRRGGAGRWPIPIGLVAPNGWVWHGNRQYRYLWDGISNIPLVVCAQTRRYPRTERNTHEERE